ncbi:MAG: TraR/DksA C4-type zinc finger protein [Candidatus Pacebacteria bacterium]|nr:TraR/DksA C4-type zinc finger protein [Candidatus Paceibacterota bacterium]
MKKELIEELKKKLEEDKANIESQLAKFADKDKNLKGDWDTRFPKMGSGDTGSMAEEQAADEVEEYSKLLSMEHSLESHLQEINGALEKIKKGIYGKCENCNQEIEEERLRAYPAAKLCLKCEKTRKET